VLPADYLDYVEVKLNTRPSRLPLSQRTYQCERCGHVAPRDKHSAHVIHNRAGFNPAGADGIRPDRSPSGQAA
jgi:putative transposase